ncbi:MAG: NAD(P)H-hydrate dehydratase [Gemmatimonadetes bacterium]|nr:NAD(P)H-hydrate dehydratase [Gemmatimonadota bacterium]
MTASGRPRATTATEAASRDRAAIAAGTPSRTLMVAAGTRAAQWILTHLADRLAHGVAVYAGAGNNGGDAWVVAAQLARAGVAVRVHAAALPATDDARHAASLAAAWPVQEVPHGEERLVIDGLLGTGHRGALRPHIAAACVQMRRARESGATIVALDVPSGLESSTGDACDGCVPAHVTLTFGTIKRGLLLRRDVAGRIVLLDIGLGAHAAGDDHAWYWATRASLETALPPIAWDAHKARRGRVGVVGGIAGMAGATILAARGALQVGAGLVHTFVDAPSIVPLQIAVPQAIAHHWPAARDTSPDDATDVLPALDALVIGPGLGRTRHTARLVESLMRAVEHADAAAALVLDADALYLVTEVAATLGTDPAALLRHWTRPAVQRGLAVVCTPHPGEFARLLGTPLPAAWDERAESLRTFAARAGVTVLLKGAPTLVSDGHDIVAAPYGTALLATGGSGDVLAGIIGTLVAQGAHGMDAALLGAALHGRAAEIITAQRRGVRGAMLDDVLHALPAALEWLTTADAVHPGLLADLPAVC